MQQDKCGREVRPAVKCVILAGGLGTRITEETLFKPKPMIEIGGRPILWHIMKTYAGQGIRDFVVCLGYKGHLVKEYFADYHMRSSDVTVDLKSGQVEIHGRRREDWTVTLAETGEHTMTGGRIRRVRRYLDGTFCMTYGDGLCDVDIRRVVAAHRRARRTATVTAVRQPGRFGALGLERGRVRSFDEKPAGASGWVNGGYFVCEPDLIDCIRSDSVVLERGPLPELAAGGRLGAYRHGGFWQPMDTLRDKNALEALWRAGRAPWKARW